MTYLQLPKNRSRYYMYMDESTGYVEIYESYWNHAYDERYPIAKGTKKLLTQIRSSICRLSYNNTKWLIPGIPEANNHREIELAFQRFKGWVAERMLKSYQEEKNA